MRSRRLQSELKETQRLFKVPVIPKLEHLGKVKPDLSYHQIASHSPTITSELFPDNKLAAWTTPSTCKEKDGIKEAFICHIDYQYAQVSQDR